MLARARRIAILVLGLGLCAVSVQADPIVVTGGSTFLYWDGGFTSARLTGSGLDVLADGIGSSTGGFLNAGLQGFNGLFLFQSTDPRTSSVTVNGTHYDAYLDGRLDFEADPLVLPPPDGPGPVTFSTPFALTGRLRGTSGPLGAGSVLFDVGFTGDGMASATAFRLTDTLYSTAGTNYQFTDPDLSPTPEPATLLLMGTGLVGMIAQARRRDRSKEL